MNRTELLHAIGWRLLCTLIVMWAAATIAYLALHLMPGDIADILSGDQYYPGLHEAIAKEWGLDRPPLEQYFSYLWRVLHGDLGRSYVMRDSVTHVIGSQIGYTLQLALTSIGLAVIFALVVSVMTSARLKVLRSLSSLFELLATSLPVFWVGILLLMVFSFHLRLFPVAGGAGFQSLVLPAITLALPTAGLLTQVLRESLEHSLEQPYMLTARSRGVSETVLRIRHGLKHAAPPALTLTGWLVGSLLGGAVITEQVFGRPGLGTITLVSVTNKDVPTVLGVVMLVAFIYVIISTLVDIIYLLIDPRDTGK